MKRENKKLVAYRLRASVISALDKLARRTGKTKTRIMEEAILLHSKEVV